MSSWACIHQANVQIIANQSESKSQTLNTQSSLKVKKWNDLTRAVAALSYCGLWFRNFSWWSIKCSSYLLLSVTCPPLNLHIARELKIGFKSGLQKHIYVTRCRWSRGVKSTKKFYSSESTSTEGKFYSIKSKSIWPESYSSKSKKVPH